MIDFGMGPEPGPDGTLALIYPLGDAKLLRMVAEVARRGGEAEQPIHGEPVAIRTLVSPSAR